jgi:HEAT repeat protein
VLPLAMALHDKNLPRRRWALLAIFSVANDGVDASQAVPALLDGTHDANVEIRAASLLALSSAKADRAVHELIAALSDPDSGVRREAANTLGMVASVRAPGALIEDSPLPTPSRELRLIRRKRPSW